MKFRRPLAAALLLAGTLSSTSCRTEAPWAFAVTRAINESGVAQGVLESSECSAYADQAAFTVLIAPILIDIVLLPITLTHDAVAPR
jgi:hypothetical protein